MTLPWLIRFAVLSLAVTIPAATIPAAAARAQKPGPPPAPVLPPMRGTGSVLTITADDFSFDAPEAIPAGLVLIKLVSQGQTAHHVDVLRVPEGISYDAVRAAIEANRLDALDLVNLGGPEVASNRAGIAAVRMELRPGRYLLVCRRKLPNGTSHAMRGMYRPFAAVPATRFATFMPPLIDATIRMHDDEIIVPATMRPGNRVFQLDNAGARDHRFVLQRLLPGKTLQDAERWDAARAGVAPYEYIGGTTRQSPRRVLWVAFVLEPGLYRVVQFDDDTSEVRVGAPRGVVKGIVVR